MINTITEEDKQYIIGVTDAIKLLRPNCDYELHGNKFFKWHDRDGLPPPSWEEVLFTMENHKIVWKKQKYSRDRVAEYPDMAEQLDKLWHQINDGYAIDQSSPWFQQIKSIKEKYPKQG